MDSTVELWTSACFLEKEGKSKAKAEACFYFESEVFHLSNAAGLGRYVEDRLRSAQQLEAPLIVIALIDGSPVWLHSVLADVLPTMKTSSLQDYLDTSKWERGTIMLPAIEKDRKLLSFYMQYPVVPTNVEQGSSTASGIKFCPVATWVAEASSTDSTTPAVPFILMACRDDQVVKSLQDHCVSGNWRLGRLSAAPARIFIDLFTLLGHWSDVWRTARRELALRDSQLHGKMKTLSVLEQTRALHRDTANVIAMREDLRLHIAAFQKFQSLIWSFANMKSSILYANKDHAAEMDERIDECLQNLNHQQESSAVIHRQLENLLSLAFNTEMVSQGQAVGRLNTLAFGFLPLSFVATIFGMTNFSISSVWYPLWAFVIVALVLLVFYLSSRFSERRLERQKNRTVDATKPTRVSVKRPFRPSGTAATSTQSLKVPISSSSPAVSEPTEPILPQADEAAHTGSMPNRPSGARGFRDRLLARRDAKPRKSKPEPQQPYMPMPAPVPVLVPFDPYKVDTPQDLGYLSVGAGMPPMSYASPQPVPYFVPVGGGFQPGPAVEAVPYYPSAPLAVGDGPSSGSGTSSSAGPSNGQTVMEIR